MPSLLSPILPTQFRFRMLAEKSRFFVIKGCYQMNLEFSELDVTCILTATENSTCLTELHFPVPEGLEDILRKAESYMLRLPDVNFFHLTLRAKWETDSRIGYRDAALSS